MVETMLAQNQPSRKIEPGATLVGKQLERDLPCSFQSPWLQLFALTSPSTCLPRQRCQVPLKERFGSENHLQKATLITDLHLGTRL